MNLYSGFVISLVMICSSLFYGIARTQSSTTDDMLQGHWQLESIERWHDGGWQVEPVTTTELRWFVYGQVSGFVLTADKVATDWFSGQYQQDEQAYHERISQGQSCGCNYQQWSAQGQDLLRRDLQRNAEKYRQYWRRVR